jgi:hypothetical protein
MKTLKELRAVNTAEDLESLNIGRLEYEISYRGGNLGFSGNSIANEFEVETWQLPGHFGAYCNYLGGGLRGSICTSNFSDTINGKKADLLNELAEACKRAYENIEAESGLIDTEDEDGETNWENLGTQNCRNAGIISAY